MDTSSIESIIRDAEEYEKRTGHMLDLLNCHLDQLHQAITLPANDPGQAMLDFVTEYINHVPHFITAVSIASEEAGISEYVEPFLKVALEYFTQPPADLDNHQGMQALLDEAYLSHRLIEEVNDQYIHRAHIPLIPMDTTKANLIVHQLIGESFANSLDEVVRITAEQLVDVDIVYSSKQFLEYVEERKGKGWEEVWKQWRDMTKTLEIDLDLELGGKTKIH